MARRHDQRPWTASDDAGLRTLYPNSPNQVIADVMGRSLLGIKNRATKLQLHKSAAYMSQYAGRIQPGASPWNKGLKGWQSGGRSADTRFKPGRRPEEARNYKPIGSLRISKDGYLERKFTDDTTLMPQRRWVAVHRQAWEAAHGTIPPGHLVRFKPGQKTTVLEHITPDRLECISRAEHAHRNHPRSKHPELARLVQLKGQITRQVNRINREHAQQEQTP